LTPSLRAFAIADYARPGMKAGYLALQNDHGADVLVLLLGRWLMAHGQTMSADAFGAAVDLARARQTDTVWPHRHARRALGMIDPAAHPETQTQKEGLLAQEVAAELAILDALAGFERMSGDASWLMADYLRAQTDGEAAWKRFIGLPAPW
jgi:uncharacterized protein (TIGR02444 family)